MMTFLASFIFVVLAKMADKTQLATVSLAVNYNDMAMVPIEPNHPNLFRIRDSAV